MRRRSIARSHSWRSGGRSGGRQRHPVRRAGGTCRFYNEEIDNATNEAVEHAPAPVEALRAAAADADAVLVVTPEYNGSIPAVIKNAIDWLSRPFGNSAVKDKPLAVIGGSFGQYGGVWAHDETRKSFGIAGARVVDAVKLSGAVQDPGRQGARRARRIVGECARRRRHARGRESADISIADKSAGEPPGCTSWRLCWLRGRRCALRRTWTGIVGGRW